MCVCVCERVKCSFRESVTDGSESGNKAVVEDVPGADGNYIRASSIVPTWKIVLITLSTVFFFHPRVLRNAALSVHSHNCGSGEIVGIREQNAPAQIVFLTVVVVSDNLTTYITRFARERFETMRMTRVASVLRRRGIP